MKWFSWHGAPSDKFQGDADAATGRKQHEVSQAQVLHRQQQGRAFTPLGLVLADRVAVQRSAPNAPRLLWASLWPHAT